MYIADQIAAYLGSAVDGLAYSEASDEGNVFVDYLPSEPEKAVCVYTYPGREASSIMSYDPARFTVVTRSEVGGVWATQMSDKIYKALHSLRYVTLPGGTFLVYCLAVHSSPFRLDDDMNARPRYSLEFRTEVMTSAEERP
jgi:hypothetical protein